MLRCRASFGSGVSTSNGFLQSAAEDRGYIIDLITLPILFFVFVDYINPGLFYKTQRQH